MNDTTSIATMKSEASAEASEAARIFYKHLKEDIVSGFNGGGKLEVFLMVAYLPVSR